MSKRTLALLLALTLAVTPLCGCASRDNDRALPAAAPGEQGKLRILSTSFPAYDWMRNILGERLALVELSLLVENGVDLHSYQPSVEDLVDIARCDLLVYLGGESDEWVAEALDTSGEPGAGLSLLAALGDAAKEEVLAEGMESDEDEDEDALDEHVWLSVKNASRLCGVLCEALCALDDEGAALYRTNTAAYQEQLAALDREYQTVVDGGQRKVLLFGDRFPFRYLADDYDLDYYAAFPGCSAETEASFETVVFLAGKLDELALDAIVKLESSDGSLARTIRDASHRRSLQILTMDSLQSVDRTALESGVSYLSVMRENLAVLREALS